MPGAAFKPPRTFPGVDALPAPLRALVEAAFPPNEVPLPGMAVMTPAKPGLRLVKGATERLVTQPKPGGTLYQALERAAYKSGIGDRLTPGEAGLLEQFKTWGK